MKRFIYAAVCFLLITACKSKKAETKEQDKKDTVVIDNNNTAKADTTETPDTKRIGGISLDMKDKEVTGLLGTPSSKSKAEEWGADGMMHQDWTYKDKGLVLNMSSENNKMDSATVFSITAENVAAGLTTKNIGIGSTYEEVRTAYSKLIDQTATDKTTITVGSIYGGIIFNFTNDKVSKIFIGAAAE